MAESLTESLTPEEEADLREHGYQAVIRMMGPQRVIDRLLATLDAARAAAPAGEAACARYWGSDGTLCATHNGRFADDTAMRCDRNPPEDARRG